VRTHPAPATREQHDETRKAGGWKRNQRQPQSAVDVPLPRCNYRDREERQVEEQRGAAPVTPGGPHGVRLSGVLHPGSVSPRAVVGAETPIRSSACECVSVVGAHRRDTVPPMKRAVLLVAVLGLMAVAAATYYRVGWSRMQAACSATPNDGQARRQVEFAWSWRPVGFQCTYDNALSRTSLWF